MQVLYPGNKRIVQSVILDGGKRGGGAVGIECTFILSFLDTVRGFGIFLGLVPSFPRMSRFLSEYNVVHQAPVVRRLDNAIHNHP